MKPHIDEAWRSLRLADRDITAFDLLKNQPEVHTQLWLKTPKRLTGSRGQCTRASSG